MSNQQNEDVPSIRKIQEVGETPFQIVSFVEKILQGYHTGIKRSLYLFKTNNGVWGYWDPKLRRVIEELQWKENSCFLENKWVPMTAYYKFHVQFFEPIVFSLWNKDQRIEEQFETTEAIISLTDAANKTFQEAMVGRAPDTWYKLQFKTQNKKGGGEMTFVEKVICAAVE